MFMKDKIIKVLQAHPKGLKAKDIAYYITNTDRRMINQVLYTNKDCFQISSDYVWTLKAKKLTDKEKVDLANIVANAVRAALQETKANNTPRTNSTKSSTVSSKRRSSFNYAEWEREWERKQKEKEEKRQKARAKIAEINKQQREKDSHIDFDQQQQIQRLEERRREQSLKERTQRENEEKSQKERYKHRYLIEDYNANSELFRKCTGDCSTCTREECIEK